MDKSNPIWKKKTFYGQTRQILSCLATVTKGMFGGENVSFKLQTTVPNIKYIDRYVAQSYWNNEEGGLPPDFSASPQTNS